MKIYISFLILFSFNNSIYIFGIEQEIWIKSGTVIIAPVQTSYSAISTDLDGRLFKTGHTETPSLKYIPRQGQVFSIFFYSGVNGLGDLWNCLSCISPNQEIMTCRKTDRETSKGVCDVVLLTQLRLIKYNDGIYTLGFLLCLREDLKKTNK